MKIKKLVTCCLTMVVIVSAMSGINALSAYEADSSTVASESATGMPLRWTNTSSVNTMLSYSGTTAKCKVEIDAFSGTTSIVANMYLYKKNADNTYSLVASWLNQTASGDYLYVSKEKTIISGTTYKLEVSAKVTRNGYTETVTGSMEKKAP